jgi:membrane-associated protease RseP (regulator of RpoE activity)
MNNLKWSWDALLVASVVFAAGTLAQPRSVAWADQAAEPEGRIVELRSGASTELPKADEQTTVTEQPAKPVYWIGIRGRVIDDPVLRTQLQLAEDSGVVVEEVVKDSPADKAGLRQHDIVLRADGEAVQGMEDLAELVTAGQGKPIQLRIIRLGQEETVVVTPEERPAGVEQASTGFPGFGQMDDQDAMRQLMERMPGLPNLPGGVRMFGPGVIINGQRLDLNSLPNGVAVTIERSNDGPAKITVKQGDKTWNIVGDDPKSLEQLPEQLRGYVQQLLGDGMPGNFNFNWQKEMEQLIPNQFGQFLQAPLPGVNPQQDPVLKKMEELERQLKDLQQRLEDSETAK